jgi:hypothetical protein
LSFVDTLSSVSHEPVQRADSANSEARARSDENSSGSTHNEDHGQNQSSIQYRQNSKAANLTPQAENASPRTQQIYSKRNLSESTTAQAKSSGAASDRASHPACLTNPEFTAQAASPFSLQSSTASPEMSGLFFAPAATVQTGAPNSASNAALPSLDSQSTDSLSGQCSDAKPHASVAELTVSSNSQNPEVGQGRDEERAFPALEASRSVASLVASKLTSLDPSELLGISAPSVDQLPTADPESDAHGIAPPNAAQTQQASFAAKIQLGSAISSSIGDVNQRTVKAIQANLSGSAFGSDSSAGDASSASKAAKANDTSSGSMPSDFVEKSSLQLQHAQGDSAQVGGVSAKGSDFSAGQPLVIATQAAPHSLDGNHSLPGSTETATHRGDVSDGAATEQWVGTESAGMSGISTARLIQTMGETEMRVGMHSTEFGDISIRTAVSQQQMQTQISVDHSELGNALSAHIPAIQAKLGSDYGLHATIEVNQSGASFSNDGDRSHQQQQKAELRTVEGVEAPTTMQSDMINLRGSAVVNHEYRLDIRA